MASKLGLDRVVIESPSTREAFAKFASLPFQIYGERDAWWPPDVESEISLLSGQSPLAGYLELLPIWAMRNGRILARATVVINHRYNEHWDEKVGQLIHFEAIADENNAVSLLMERACEWFQARQMTAIRSGFAAFLDYPYTIDEYGAMPSFLLRSTPPYYHQYFKDAGFATEKGMVDYTAALTSETLDRYRHLAGAATHNGIAIRSWREYGFGAAADAWTNVTNAAFARHWGWNPIMRGEVRPMLMPLCDTLVADLSTIALVRGAPVGSVFSVPDMSSSLARIRSGCRLSEERGGGTRGALINIGVLDEMRRRGIAAAMAATSYLAMARRGMKYAGYTLVLDDNRSSRRTAQKLQARVTGNFVVYRREL